MNSRRRTTIALAVAVVLVAAACQQWPSMRGDTANTGFNGSENALSLADAGTVTQLFTADLGQPAEGWQTPIVSGTQIYAPTAAGLAAYDLNGVGGCSGVPKVCQPLWRGDVSGQLIGTSAAIGGASVFVTAGTVGQLYQSIYAFDLRGETGCSGTPRVCQPLWTAPHVTWAPPVVSGSTLYAVNDDGGIAAYDLAGSTGCGGTPKVCSPMWSTSYDGPTFSSPVAVANGTVYYASFDGEVLAFDAAGVNGCGGIPKTCEPLWIGETGGEPAAWPTAAVVSGNRVYAAMEPYDWGSPPPDDTTIVKGFALDGGSACTQSVGSPRVCQPEWSATVAGSTASDEIAAAYGSIYVQTHLDTWPSTVSQLAAIDQDDPACTPGPCGPSWTAPLSSAAGLASPIVANGVVYADRAGSAAAIDAHGIVGCSGSPKTCTPVTFASYPDPSSTGWGVSNGKLVVITDDGASAPWPAGPRQTLRVFG